MSEELLKEIINTLAGVKCEVNEAPKIIYVINLLKKEAEKE